MTEQPDPVAAYFAANPNAHVVAAHLTADRPADRQLADAAEVAAKLVLTARPGVQRAIVRTLPAGWSAVVRVEVTAPGAPGALTMLVYPRPDLDPQPTVAELAAGAPRPKPGPCESCGKTFDACTRLVLGSPGRACCPPCGNRVTHPGDTLTLSDYYTREELDKMTARPR